MAVEGLDVIREALKYNVEIISVFYNDDELRNDAKELLGELINNCDDVYKISLKTFDSIKWEENVIPIIIVIKYKELTLKDIDIKKHKLIVVNDRIELPGNLVTIYRSAYASGVDLIINVNPVTSIYKEKFIASSRETVFAIPTINTTYAQAQEVLLNLGYDICLCEPSLGVSYNDFGYDTNTALVVGNERFGINSKWYDNKNKKNIYSYERRN